MTVAQLSLVLPASEFIDWIAFFEEKARRQKRAQEKAEADQNRTGLRRSIRR